MIQTEQEKLRDEIVALAERYGRNRGALIPILQEIQKKRFQISDFAMQLIADMLDIHPVEVYSVISFYSFLDFAPKGKFVIRLCRTISCDMQGKERVARQLENDLGINFGETTPDGKFTLEWANCLGMCDQGPAMLINDRVFTEVTPEKIHEILEECRGTFGIFSVENQEGRSA
ncbi:MAG TPA: NADH-quinone oxidoreductase subunit NuoE [Acidobacteriota bacterium]|nr:NADH-quinone oxidoreductase subunit NuoE [Acidobacteriota bacterium]